MINKSKSILSSSVVLAILGLSVVFSSTSVQSIKYFNVGLPGGVTIVPTKDASAEKKPSAKKEKASTIAIDKLKKDQKSEIEPGLKEKLLTAAAATGIGAFVVGAVYYLYKKFFKKNSSVSKVAKLAADGKTEKAQEVLKAALKDPVKKAVFDQQLEALRSADKAAFETVHRVLTDVQSAPEEVEILSSKPKSVVAPKGSDSKPGQKKDPSMLRFTLDKEVKDTVLEMITKAEPVLKKRGSEKQKQLFKEVEVAFGKAKARGDRCRVKIAKEIAQDFVDRSTEIRILIPLIFISYPKDIARYQLAMNAVKAAIVVRLSQSEGDRDDWSESSKDSDATGQKPFEKASRRVASRGAISRGVEVLSTSSRSGEREKTKLLIKAAKNAKVKRLGNTFRVDCPCDGAHKRHKIVKTIV